MGSPAAPAAAYVTPDEYLQLERKAEFRSEYLDGKIVAMAGGSREHSLIASSLLAEVFLQLKGKACETHGSDLRIWMPSVGTFAYPDMLVICGEPRFRSQDPDTVENPAFIAEVCPTQLRNTFGRRSSGIIGRFQNCVRT